MSKMYNEKPSTKILRIVASVRDSLDRIEHGQPASFHEIKRLEKLDDVLSATLFDYLQLEFEQ